MSRLEILAMEAGERLSKAVAEEIFEECWHYPIVGYNQYDMHCQKCGSYDYRNKPYSTDISSAFQIVDKMKEDSFSLELIVGSDGYTLARFFDASQIIPDDRSNQMVCDTVPEAICKSALLHHYDAFQKTTNPIKRMGNRSRHRCRIDKF